MSEFLFLRPLFLWLFIPFFAFLCWYIFSQNKSSLWNKVCSKELLPYVLKQNGRRFNFFNLFLFCIGSILIVALAGPSGEKVNEPLIQTESGLVILLDLSPEMDAQDLKPSRLQRAIYKIKDLLETRKEGQTALVVFSDNPFTVTPLTDDVNAIQALLPALETRIMPTGGHQADKAIAHGADLLRQGGIEHGSLLLITHSVSDEELKKSQEIVSHEKVTLSVLGVGTEEGAPIPQREGGFLKDSNGKLILSQLAKENLIKLAHSSRGIFAPLTHDEKDILHLSPSFSSLTNQETKDTLKNRAHDQGYLLVLIALPFALFFFRKGLFIWIFFFPFSIQALSWEDCWKTADQQAAKYYQQQNYQQAKELFEQSDWKGASHYQLGEYEAAADSFKSNQTAEGLYNYGTAKAKQADYKSALEAYEKCLQQQPDHEDALYNKKLIEEMQKQQEQKQEKNESQDQQDKKENQSDQKEQQEQQPNQKQEQPDQKDNPADQKAQESDQKDNPADKKPQESDQKENGQSEEPQKQKKEEDKDLHDQFKSEMDKQMEEKKKEQEVPVPQVEEQPEKDPQDLRDERLLQKIKDDPGGLLRRKFMLQYRERNQK